MVDHTTNRADEFATVIGADARFKGELTFQGGVRVDGQLEGSIETTGRVHVSPTGELKAEVKASSVVLEGRLFGNVTAQDRVELKASGQMHGDLKAAKLLVLEGATFVGRCEVGPNVKAATTPTRPGNGEAEMRPVSQPAVAARK